MTENRWQVFKITLAVCLVCSVCISTSAVLLRPAQQANARLDKQRNILVAAGLIAAAADSDEVRRRFAEVEPRLVDLDNGVLVEPDVLQLPSEDDFRLNDLLASDQLSVELDADQDLPGIRRRERYQQIYLVRNQRGELERLILPIRGYGLWSTLYGFIALQSDGNTVTGLGFYQHGETPGLGGEVDNPRWQALWKGKQIYPPGSYGQQVAIRVLKGRANRKSSLATAHHIDGLSGATLTSRGVDNMLQFWLGRFGFAKLLINLRQGEPENKL